MNRGEFSPKVDPKLIAGLTCFTGPNGRFAMAVAGSRPDIPRVFYYGDDSCEFFFYASLENGSIVVYAARVLPFEPTKPKIDANLVCDVERNIHRTFLTHSYIDFSEGDYSDRSVTFAWEFAK